MKLKKLIEKQNDFLKNEFEMGRGSSPSWVRLNIVNDYIEKYSKRIKMSYIDRRAVIYGNYEYIENGIPFKIRTKKTSSNRFSWVDVMKVYSIELLNPEEDSKYLEMEVSEVLDIISKRDKKSRENKDSNDKYNFDIFMKALSDKNITYKEFEDIKLLERKLSYKYEKSMIDCI